MVNSYLLLFSLDLSLNLDVCSEFHFLSFFFYKFCVTLGES